MSTSGPPIEGGSSLSWEGDKMFNIYIYDYCHKRGFKKTAGALLAEADIPPDSTPPINARQGLLFEWWSVFWVLFTAKANGQGPEDAMIYTQHQANQAAKRQQQANQPMRVNGQPFPRPPPVNGTPPSFGMRPQPPRQNGGPPFQQDAQNNAQRPPYNRPPSRAGTPAAMMSSPSMMNRQPIADLNSELQKIPQQQLLQLKQELGLEAKDLPSLTMDDKQRLLNLHRQRPMRTKPPNATPGPSMPPQPIRNPNPAVRPVKRSSTSPGDDQEPPPGGSSPPGKRMRRSPMEQSQNPNPTNPMPPMPYSQIPPGQPQPPHMGPVVRMPPQNGGFNPGMAPGPPMMNTMPMGMPGQPPLGSAPVPIGAMGGLPNHQAGMMTSQMQMHHMQNRGGGPGGGPGSDPSANPQPQQYRQPPHMQVMHGGPPGPHPPGMQGGRPGMMHPPGPPAGSPESGGFNPGGPHPPPPQFAGGPPGPPRMGGPPGQPMGPMQGMMQGQPKHIGMLPPPSPGMSKDGQGGMGVVGMSVGVMSQHTGGGMPQPGQQPQPKDALGGGPGPAGVMGAMKPDGSPHNHTLGGTPANTMSGPVTAPATPQGQPQQPPPPPQSQQQPPQVQGQGQPPPPQSMSAPPQMGGPMGNPTFGVNPMNAGMNPSMNPPMNPMNVPGGGMDSSLLNPSEMFLNPDFINSVASSLDDFDASGMFRNGDDINFERDFGQWFSPDGIAGSLDMK